MNDDESTAVQLRRTIIHLARKFNASSTDEGLTPSQASALGLVAFEGSIPIGDIARLDNLNPTMVSRIVGVLESKGLVDRRRDPADQRAFIVRTTPAGVALDARVREQRVARVAGAAATLAPEQRAAIDAALTALEALADAMP